MYSAFEICFLNRMQDDLSTLTRENQDINIELDDAMRDRDELKKTLDDHVTRVSLVESNIAAKVMLFA